MSYDEPIGICHGCGDITSRYNLCDDCWHYQRGYTIARHIDAAVQRIADDHAL